MTQNNNSFNMTESELKDLLLQHLHSYHDEFYNTDCLNIQKHAFNHGWVLPPDFVIVIGQRLSTNFYADSDTTITKMLEDDGEWGDIWQRIYKEYPSRLSLLNEAERSFKMGLYGATILLLLSQLDGIFCDRFPQTKYSNFYSKDSGTSRSVKLLEPLRSAQAAWGKSEELRNQYVSGDFAKLAQNPLFTEGLRILEIVVKDSTGTNEDTLKIPNRHGVLHGQHYKYGTKSNALKSIMFFYFFTCFFSQPNPQNGST